jgi:hypothetical protein
MLQINSAEDLFNYYNPQSNQNIYVSKELIPEGISYFPFLKMKFESINNKHISEIYTKVPTNDIPFYYKQLWDCFSENVAVVEYEFLAFHKAQVVLRDGSKVWATYILTIDWYNNPYSKEPSDYKCGHLLESDDGYLLCMPNNRIFWKDSNFVTKPLPDDLKQFKVDTELPSVENQSDRWVAEDTNSFYYDIIENI